MSMDKKKKLGVGLGLMVGFLAILIAIFLPFFEGKNGLNYMDDLYNSISKGSAYYIPKLIEDAKGYANNNITVTITLATEKQTKDTELLISRSGATATVTGNQIEISGSLGKMLATCLEDADDMFHNRGDTIRARYNYDEKQVLFNWWTAFHSMIKNLEKQKKFAEAKFIATALSKGVECSYNFYKIEPQKITDRVGIVLFSLIFYVIYTMWYGFAIMFLFEGWGLQLGHH